MEAEEPSQQPKRKKFMAAVIIIVILISIGLWLTLGRSAAKDKASSATPATTASTNPVDDTVKVDLYQEKITIGARYVTPVSLSVKVGDSVAWINKDRSEHSIVSDTGPGTFKGQGPLAYNDMYLVTFKTAGTYTYHDTSNAGSKGTITVE